MFNKKAPKTAKTYDCSNCQFICCKQSDWSRHLTTQKHIKNTNLTHIEHPLTKKTAVYLCEKCNKPYQSRVGLWYHHKKCIELNKDEKEIKSANEVKILTNLVLEMVKSNTALQQQMLELCKNTNNNTINNNTINSNNKTFNLQLFLNEECKDAMNMSEFIASIQLQISDLENMGKLGYTEGMYNIIMNEIVDMETFKRPIHCSDLKRETLYIKEENKWEKEGPDNKKMKNALRHIEQKNFKLLNEWQAKHPHFKECSSSENDTYLQIVSNATNGTPENMNKVIKKMMKKVVIEKN
jgi:hypothetical protein